MSIDLRQCPYDHLLNNKAHLSDVTVTNILKVLPTKWRRKPAGIDIERKYATVTVCVPLGAAYVRFTKTGDYFSWRKAETFVNNVIVGKLWIDHNGRTTITNYTNKDYCELIMHARTREVQLLRSFCIQPTC